MTNREYYNIYREKVCNNLNITKNQFNSFRRLGEKIHKINEDQCNGFPDFNGNWDEEAEKKAEIQEEQYKKLANDLAEKLNLYIFFQGDPRGATIYLDTHEIQYNNYKRAQVIY